MLSTDELFKACTCFFFFEIAKKKVEIKGKKSSKRALRNSVLFTILACLLLLMLNFTKWSLKFENYRFLCVEFVWTRNKLLIAYTWVVYLLAIISWYYVSLVFSICYTFELLQYSEKKERSVIVVHTCQKITEKKKNEHKVFLVVAYCLDGFVLEWYA